MAQRGAAEDLWDDYEEVAEEPLCVPWITHHPGKGIEVTPGAERFLSSVQAPLDLVIFYGEGGASGREERSEVIIRSFFPNEIGSHRASEAMESAAATLSGADGGDDLAPSCPATSGGGVENQHVDAALIRLWTRVMRIKRVDGSTVSVVVADAMDQDGVQEGLILALCLLLSTHVVYYGERLLDDDRIVGLRAVQSIPKVVSTGEGDPKDWKAYASCLPRLTWLLSGLDEERLAGERCRGALEESSYLQSRLEPKHPESDCVRSMLASLFPSQDCIRLAPSPATSRSPTGEVLPNEMLLPAYVSSLASIRRRIVSAPRPTTARLPGGGGGIAALRLSQAYLAGWSKFRVLHVQSAWTAVNRSACGDAMMHAVGVYMQLAAEVAGRCPCSDQYLSEAHASATKEAFRAFSEAAGGGAERETFRQVLEQRMQDGHRKLAAHNEAASRRLAVELIESLYAERLAETTGGSVGGFKSVAEFEEARDWVSKEYATMSKDLSRYSAKLVLLEFFELRLLELSRELQLQSSPARNPLLAGSAVTEGVLYAACEQGGSHGGAVVASSSQSPSYSSSSSSPSPSQFVNCYDPVASEEGTGWKVEGGVAEVDEHPLGPRSNSGASAPTSVMSPGEGTEGHVSGKESAGKRLGTCIGGGAHAAAGPCAWDADVEGGGGPARIPSPEGKSTCSSEVMSSSWTSSEDGSVEGMGVLKEANGKATSVGGWMELAMEPLGKEMMVVGPGSGHVSEPKTSVCGGKANPADRVGLEGATGPTSQEMLVLDVQAFQPCAAGVDKAGSVVGCGKAGVATSEHAVQQVAGGREGTEVSLTPLQKGGCVDEEAKKEREAREGDAIREYEAVMAVAAELLARCNHDSPVEAEERRKNRADAAVGGVDSEASMPHSQRMMPPGNNSPAETEGRNHRQDLDLGANGTGPTSASASPAKGSKRMGGGERKSLFEMISGLPMAAAAAILSPIASSPSVPVPTSKATTTVDYASGGETVRSVEDPASRLLRCKCKRLRCVEAPKPRGHVGPWRGEQPWFASTAARQCTSRFPRHCLRLEGGGLPRVVSWQMAKKFRNYSSDLRS